MFCEYTFCQMASFAQMSFNFYKQLVSDCPNSLIIHISWPPHLHHITTLLYFVYFIWLFLLKHTLHCILQWLFYIFFIRCKCSQKHQNPCYITVIAAEQLTGYKRLAKVAMQLSGAFGHLVCAAFVLQLIIFFPIMIIFLLIIASLSGSNAQSKFYHYHMRKTCNNLNNFFQGLEAKILWKLCTDITCLICFIKIKIFKIFRL
jgi:hypothetical protein